MDSRRRAAAIALGLVLGAVPVPALAASDPIDVGAEALAITGTHTGLFGDTLHGAVPGALLEIEAHDGRAGVRLETLPVAITVPAGGRGSYGPSNLGLAIVNGELTADLIRDGALRAGIGGQIVDLHNYDGTNGEREAARATGVSYVLASDAPLGRRTALYARLSLIPNVRASLLRYPRASGAFPPIAEVGAETDAALGYAWRTPGAILRAGVRGVNYSTRDALRGTLVDRNVGGGVFVEALARVGVARDR